MHTHVCVCVCMQIPDYEPLAVFLGSRERFYYPLTPKKSSAPVHKQSLLKTVGIVVDIVRKSDLDCPEVIIRTALKVSSGGVIT